MVYLESIQNNGIIGAGGAGFPTSVKVDSRPDIVIVNAAECEPLLHKDMQIIHHYSDEMIKGLQIVMELTGAKRGIIGIKEKHKNEIELLKSKVTGNIEVVPVEDVYPAGDEVVLIHMTTGRVVQPGQLPISEGCVVQNVETLYNIAVNKPVAEKFISVAGAVKNPATLKVPVGITYAEILSKFEITTEDYVVRVGGLMMGHLEYDLNSVVTKRTGALIVLPKDHHCVEVYNRYATPHDTDRIAKAACDQCNICTELCPRYLIGQPVRPEMAMRNRMFTREDEPLATLTNISCCECNLCTMYSCPEGLDPTGATIIEKRMAQSIGYKPDNQKRVTPHPMSEFRKVPTKKLMQRLDVLKYKDEGPLRKISWSPNEVRVPINQHIGAPSKPIVKIGQQVIKYELIGAQNGKISSNSHASIDGVVANILENEIVINRK